LVSSGTCLSADAVIAEDLRIERVGVPLVGKVEVIHLIVLVALDKDMPNWKRPRI
jgi:hypothetical protein